MSMAVLMTGNEAIARGAYEAGVSVATGYPGTPSTEILENIIQYKDIYAQWSPNEKVALEVGIGASIAGGRTLVTMKHVGVNVAADPLFTMAYTGVNGGLVLISADDPGMHSSQNEQDNRLYGRAAKVPVIEPSDSQEAKDFMKIALEISEQYDAPVILRTTTRVAHSQSLVELGEPQPQAIKPYQKDPKKYVAMPANARLRHVQVEAKMVELAAAANTLPINRIEWADRSLGIITSGFCYQYVKEALPQASILKLGMTNPLPAELIKDFAQGVERLVVVEELEPFIEEQVAAMGIKVEGKKLFSNIGEISAKMVAAKLGGLEIEAETVDTSIDLSDIPMRPPVLCPGCPHRSVFYTLNQLKAVVSGDIGCYTLGAVPPLNAMDTTICMGASIGAALGMEKANPDLKGKVVAVIGDSTFFHSGITGLVDMVYNQGQSTVLILDNSTTAMTGHQDNPATGKTLQKEITHVVDIEGLVKALGIKRVQVVDPFDMSNLKKVIATEMATPEPSVIIARRPCALLLKGGATPYVVEDDTCISCRACIRLGCPAISGVGTKITIDPNLCTGCGVCEQVCPVTAIKKVGDQ